MTRKSTSYLTYVSLELSSNRNEASRERSLDIAAHRAEGTAVCYLSWWSGFRSLRRLGKDVEYASVREGEDQWLLFLSYPNQTDFCNRMIVGSTSSPGRRAN